MIVLLGEVGGVEEYKIVDALKTKKITKPLVAWCIGTCADHITSEVRIFFSRMLHYNQCQRQKFLIITLSFSQLLSTYYFSLYCVCYT